CSHNISGIDGLITARKQNMTCITGSRGPDYIFHPDYISLHHIKWIIFRENYMLECGGMDYYIYAFGNFFQLAAVPYISKITKNALIFIFFHNKKKFCFVII